MRDSKIRSTEYSGLLLIGKGVAELFPLCPPESLCSLGVKGGGEELEGEGGEGSKNRDLSVKKCPRDEWKPQKLRISTIVNGNPEYVRTKDGGVRDAIISKCHRKPK